MSDNVGDIVAYKKAAFLKPGLKKIKKKVIMTARAPFTVQQAFLLKQLYDTGITQTAAAHGYDLVDCLETNLKVCE